MSCFRRALLGVALSLTAACGAPVAKAPVVAPVVRPAPPLPRLPLLERIPAAGLRWLLVARLAELWRDPAARAAVERVLEKERLDAFAKVAGLDLRTTPEALAAGYELATFYAASVHDDERVEARLVERTLLPPRRAQPHPELRRLTGTLGDAPFRFVRVRGQAVGSSVGDPLPARAFEAFSRGLLRDSRPALRGVALVTVADVEPSWPVHFYAAGPFEQDFAEGAHGLLAAANAAVIAARPVGDEVEVLVVLHGDFAALGGSSTARLLDTWDDLANSALGSMLALKKPRAAPVLSAAGSTVRLRVFLGLPELATALKTTVSGEVGALLGDVSPPAGTPRAREAAPLKSPDRR